jgi:hypothetical protein
MWWVLPNRVGRRGPPALFRLVCSDVIICGNCLWSTQHIFGFVCVEMHSVNRDLSSSTQTAPLYSINTLAVAHTSRLSVARSKVNTRLSTDTGGRRGGRGTCEPQIIQLQQRNRLNKRLKRVLKWFLPRKVPKAAKWAGPSSDPSADLVSHGQRATLSGLYSIAHRMHLKSIQNA